MTRERIQPDQSRETHVKLGTMAGQTVYIHEDDFPLEEGKHVRYAEGRHGWQKFGVVTKLIRLDGQDEPARVLMSRDGLASEVEAYDRS